MPACLYVAYHLDAPIVTGPGLIPIHVGRATATSPLMGMIGDDTGDNISDQNAHYCELTALYWAWKNDTDSSHIGLMHYRRFLDLTGAYPSHEAENYIDRLDLTEWTASVGDWLASDDLPDIVVPMQHEMGRTLEGNYRKRHRPRDFDALRQIINEHHADWSDAFETAAAKPSMRLGNIALMRRDLLDEYCIVLFDVLARLAEAPVDRSNYSAQQQRYLGYVAERLLTVFMKKMSSERPELKVLETNIINTSKALVTPHLTDDRLNGPANVNIAVAADNDYLPHTAAMLRSVAEHSNPDRIYTVFFLASGIPPARMDILRGMLMNWPNMRLEPMWIGDQFADSHRSATRAPSNATYNRFLLFDLLPGLDRLLYLDGDMVVLGDVAEIFDTDLEGNPVGGVTDYIMTRTLTGPTPTLDPDVPDLTDYHRKTLGLNDAQIARYMNAGLLLFDFSKMDTRKVGADLMKMASSTKYLFRDQDILNVYFKDTHATLPARYNVFNTIPAGYGRVPAPGQKEAIAAKANPMVVHFAAGDYKPWNGRAVPQAELYWQTLIKTPFYGEIISRLQSRTRQRGNNNGLVAYGRLLAERMPALRRPLVWVYRTAQRLRGN